MINLQKLPYCPCGNRPILKRKPFGIDLVPEYVIECSCGERGINGKTKGNAVYGWIRRKQLREAISFILQKPEFNCAP
jgi:hypothetical protein